MRVAFWGNFGTYNLGNECTLHAILRAARRYVPDAEILAVCNNPADTIQRHRIPAVPIAPALPRGQTSMPRPVRVVRRLAVELRDWVRAVGAMRRAEILIVTGTGILTDENEGMFGMPYQMLKWVCAARLCRADVYFVSVGAEGLIHPVKVRFLAWALRLARYRSYRDSASRARASRLVRAASRDPVYPDLAFSLPRSLMPGHDSSPGMARAVAVGIYAVETGAAGMRAYVEALGASLLWLLERGYRVRIVIGDADYDQVARTHLRAWLQERNALDRVLDEPASSFEELIGQLAEAEFVVATRFHNLVLALLLHKPVISMSHMDKNDALMASTGLSEYCLSLNNLQPAQLFETFERMERCAQPLRRLIQEKTEGYREALEEQYAIVFGRAENHTVREDLG